MVRPRPASIALSGVLLLAACATGTGPKAGVSDHPQGPANSRSPQTSNDPYARLILRDGDKVRASGQVVSVPGKPVRFCTPAASDLMVHPIMYCDNGIDVVGVNLHRLADRKTEHGAVQGNAQLTGTYCAGTLRVTAQGPPVYDNGHVDLFRDPPCPAPPGGWPPAAPGYGGNLDERPVQAYRHAHPGSIMQFALARPAQREVAMLVLATGRPGPIRRALRDDYPDQLCVIHSRYTKADVHAARRALMLDTPDGLAAGSWSIGQGLTRRSQVDVEVQIRQVTPAVAADAARQAAGLVELKPWLAPRR